MFRSDVNRVSSNMPQKSFPSTRTITLRQHISKHRQCDKSYFVRKNVLRYVELSEHRTAREAERDRRSSPRRGRTSCESSFDPLCWRSCRIIEELRLHLALYRMVYQNIRKIATSRADNLDISKYGTAREARHDRDRRHVPR